MAVPGLLPKMSIITLFTGHHLKNNILHIQNILRLDSTVQELCENQGGRPGLSVLTSLLVSVDVKLY